MPTYYTRMKKRYKVNLHAHTGDDPKDAIPYSTFEYIDDAKEKGFDAIAVTCHDLFVDNPEYISYARERRIALIPGIEKLVEGRDVVILNADKKVEDVDTFEKLYIYKREHPDIFILAPHPFYPPPFSSLRSLARKHIDVFDAIEFSWFYSRTFNWNPRAERLARKYGKPFISTSDTHDLSWLEYSFCLVTAEDSSPTSLFRAIREGRIENKTSPRRFFREMAVSAFQVEIRKIFN